MGVPPDPSCRVLNAIGDFVMAGGELVPLRRYSGFVDRSDVVFRAIAPRHFREYLGYANWFYRSWPTSFPAMQCVWPDLNGVFPDEAGFEERFRTFQADLSL